MADNTRSNEPSSPVAAKSDSEKPQASGADAAKAQANLKARKRTKTGCLTCRKRRIKCGEERPVCANCIKSKRTCEGYAPRVVFKDPHSTYPPGWTIPGYPYQPRPGLPGQYIRPHPNAAFSSQFPAIAPRPMPGQGEYFVAPSQLPPNWQHGQPIPGQGTYVLVPQASYNTQLEHGYPPFTTAPPSSMQQSPIYGETLMPVSQPEVGHIVTTGQPGITPQWLSNAVAHELASHQAPASVPSPVTPVSAVPRGLPQPQIVQHSPTWAEEHESFSEARHHYPPLDAAPTRSHPAIVPFQPESPLAVYDQAAVDTGHNHFASEMGNPGSNPESQQQPQTQTNASNDEEKTKSPPKQPLLLELSTTVAEEEEDDDYYDVMSDEEEVQSDNDVTMGPPPKDVQHILTLANSRPEHELGSYHAFIDDANTLATYIPKYHNSPLMHPPTARIFCHFVAATGPLLSSYGRHTVNPALFFSGHPAPKSHQALWTYTIPTLALSNPALLQSMLALSSLQISRLQSTPLTIPMKHYQFALRRVAKSVAVPSKRSSISTLAATLLLSHFEVISGEHAKWNSHLAGARQLLIEVDYKGMTRRIVEEKARRASNVDVDWSRPYVNAQFQSYGDDLPWVPEPNSPDESVVSQITGMRIKYERHGSILDESNVTISSGRLSKKEMDDYQTYRDLFWFYTKLDMIQALLRGRRLLYPFDRWAHCPPRGPIGRIDAVYGSLDHVHILLGRIAEFAGKDVIRKRKAMKMNGGVWIPPSGMFPNGPPQGQSPTAGPPIGMPPPTPTSMSSGGHSDTSSNGPQRPKMPPGSGQPSFYGMMPDTGTSYDLPEAFASAPRENIYVPPSPDENFELATATAAAEEEWKSIQKALTVFEQSLGPTFMPLADDAGPVIATPFGLALQYSTYQVALCWIMFYMGRIMSARSNPSMPPASMMASGVAASMTAEWANTIGRITFGMQTPPDDQPLNPVFGGAIAETMLPLFVAGVQYQNPFQRAYTIDRLHLIAERIGHDSAALIAAGLETVWIRQAEMGRGPRYDPTMRITDEHGENLVFDSVKSRQPLGKSFTPRGKVEEGEISINADKRSAVYLQPDTKEFAAGLMAVEENLGSLDIRDGGR